MHGWIHGWNPAGHRKLDGQLTTGGSKSSVLPASKMQSTEHPLHPSNTLKDWRAASASTSTVQGRLAQASSPTATRLPPAGATRGTDHDAPACPPAACCLPWDTAADTPGRCAARRLTRQRPRKSSRTVEIPSRSKRAALRAAMPRSAARRATRAARAAHSCAAPSPRPARPMRPKLWLPRRQSHRHGAHPGVGGRRLLLVLPQHGELAVSEHFRTAVSGLA